VWSGRERKKTGGHSTKLTRRHRGGAVEKTHEEVPSCFPAPGGRWRVLTDFLTIERREGASSPLRNLRRDHKTVLQHHAKRGVLSVLGKRLACAWSAAADEMGQPAGAIPRSRIPNHAGL